MRESYFIKDKTFFKSLFRIMVIVLLQNFINYSVNMADNLMLGNYGQNQLTGVACVSQIFFMLSAFGYNFGAAFSVLAAQYWGKKRPDQINRLGGILLRVDLLVGIIFFAAAALFPYQLVRIFTSDAAIIEQGVIYLNILKWIFIPYVISTCIMDMLRNVETVSIAFYISISSLVINVVFNYLLIFGKFGFPEMGVAGAAISTLAARLVEVTVLLIYLAFVDKKLKFFRSDFWKWNGSLGKDFARLAITIVPGGIAWSLATPVQTALLGMLTSDAIAANSVAGTFYQLLKVAAQAMSAASAVMIGKTVGEGDFAKVRSAARTIEAISLGIGLVLGGLLFSCRGLILKLYDLTPEAQRLTGIMIVIMSVVMVGMAYEVPILFGTIRAGGDAKYPTIINVGVLWAIVMPLAIMAVLWWHLDTVIVVMIIQSEQILKCIPAAIRLRQYDKWIKPRTKDC